jgi:hypothetical protein
MDHRASYLQKYREDNRAYFNQKAREQAERDKVKYGKQARCSTRKFFNGEPLQGITIEKKAITISFD